MRATTPVSVVHFSDSVSTIRCSKLVAILTLRVSETRSGYGKPYWEIRNCKGHALRSLCSREAAPLCTPRAVTLCLPLFLVYFTMEWVDALDGLADDGFSMWAPRRCAKIRVSLALSLSCQGGDRQ